MTTNINFGKSLAEVRTTRGKKGREVKETKGTEE